MTRHHVAAAFAALFLALSCSVHAQGAAAPTTAPSAATTPGATASPAASVTPTPASTADGSAKRPGDTRGTSLDRSDRVFLKRAAQGGLKEVEFGKLAAAKATDPGVKAFAERMVKNHGEANKKLMDLSQSKGLVQPTAIRPGDQREMDKLESLSGAQFDEAYLTNILADHKADVRDFDKHAKRADDADVKKFAADTLPTLQEHLRMAEETYAKMGGNKKGARARK
ncbi:MAG: DUF4142 domain-containing protein [Casimicrobiaceae bacterium]